MLGVTHRSQLNAAFGKASRGVPKAVRDAHYDLSKIKIQGEPVWHFLQFKGQKVDAHDMADLLRRIDAVAGDGVSFDSLRRFVHTPMMEGGDDAAAATGVAGALFSQLCMLPSAVRALECGPCSPTTSVNLLRGWRPTAPALL